MTITGGCHCGAVRYEAEGEPEYHALCHCTDCRRAAGAPMVGWAAFKQEQVTVHGDTTQYESSDNGRRRFCPKCGTGLFYANAVMLPGLIDVQSATLDDPGRLSPQVHVQAAERIGWPTGVGQIPEFDRFPEM